MSSHGPGSLHHQREECMKGWDCETLEALSGSLITLNTCEHLIVFDQ